MLAALIVLAACGTSTDSSQPPAAASAAPTASGAAASVGPPAPDDSADPSPRRWPEETVSATIALGAADAEIGKAGADLQAAAGAEDLRAMWGAADGLAKLIDANMSNIDALELDPATKDAAAVYRRAFPALASGARHLRDAITAGDAAAIVAGTREVTTGLADYATIRPSLADLVEQALVQKRLYLR